MSNKELLNILADELVDELFDDICADMETASYRAGWNGAMKRALILIKADLRRLEET